MEPGSDSVMIVHGLTSEQCCLPDQSSDSAKIQIPAVVAAYGMVQNGLRITNCLKRSGVLGAKLQDTYHFRGPYHRCP